MILDIITGNMTHKLFKLEWNEIIRAERPIQPGAV